MGKAGGGSTAEEQGMQRTPAGRGERWLGKALGTQRVTEEQLVVLWPLWCREATSPVLGTAPAVQKGSGNVGGDSKKRQKQTNEWQITPLESKSRSIICLI